jgi:hypothetical protein
MPEYKLSMIVEAHDRASGALKSAGGAVNDFGATVAKLAGAFGLTLGLTALAQGVKQFTAESITAFSDLRESSSKMQAVFKAATPTITTFAQNSARDLGMSKQAAYEATSTFGNLFTSMGLGVAPAAAMSTGLVKLATDLSSFNNISPDEALIRLRSGIVGEVEPLRTLGINIDAVTVKNKAMAMGLADVSGAVSYAALIEARYALILEQSTNAQGDRARTSDELAGSLRTQAAAMQDLKAAWGAFAAPTYTAALHAITGDVEALTALLLKQQYVITGDKATYFQQIIAEATKANSATEPLFQQMNTLLEQRQRMLDLPAFSRLLDPTLGGQVDGLTAKIRALEWQILALTTPTEDAERAYTLAMSKMVAATGGLAPAEAQAAADAKTLGDALASLRGKEAGANVNAVAAGILAGKLTEAQAAAWGLAGSLAFLNGQGGAPDMGAYWNQAAGNQPTMTLEGLRSWQTSAAQVQIDFIARVRDEAEKSRLAGVKAAGDIKAANEKAAADTQAAWRKAFDGLASAAQSAVDKSKGRLLDLLPKLKTTADWATDPNGPFKLIGRAADVAEHGTASPWAQEIAGQLKTDMDHVQAEAKKYTEGYAQNPYSAASQALVDQPSLISHIVSDANAQADMEAFGVKIAALAQASPGLKAGGAAITAAVTAGLGASAATGKDSAGVQTTSYAAAAKDMLGGFAGALQTQVVDKALGAELRNVGATTFGIFEAGVIDAAGKSSGLKAVIYAMLAAASASQAAARAAGVND